MLNCAMILQLIFVINSATACYYVSFAIYNLFIFVLLCFVKVV